MGFCFSPVFLNYVRNDQLSIVIITSDTGSLWIPYALLLHSRSFLDASKIVIFVYCLFVIQARFNFDFCIFESDGSNVF